MSLIDEARKLDQSDIAFAIGIFISIIAPGFLIIYHYKPALIGSLDTFKLSIFCAALTLPVVIVNYICASILTKAVDQHAENFVIAMGMTCLVLYVALLISYFVALTFKWFLVSVIVLQGLLILAVYIDHRPSNTP